MDQRFTLIDEAKRKMKGAAANADQEMRDESEEKENDSSLSN